MSVQEAKDFLVKVSTDAATAEKAREAHEAALLSVAQQEGFDVSAEDLQAAMSEVAVLDDLAADDVDSVVGVRASPAGTASCGEVVPASWRR